MSRRYTYYGSKKSKDYFLDLYPSEYYYSLNRGSNFSGDVARLRQNATGTEINVVSEDITQSNLTALFPTSGSLRARIIYNQGNAGVRDFSSVLGTEGANVADVNRLPIFFNSMLFLGFAANLRHITSNLPATVLDKNSTVYLVYRSQNATTNENLFYEDTEASGNVSIGMLSDTRATTFIHTSYRPQGTTSPVTLNYASQQPTDTLRVVAYRKTGNTIEAFDENGLIASATSSLTFSLSTKFYLGSRFTSPVNFTGFVGAVIVRAQSDSNSTLNDIFDFLKNEYGI
jgi:hypothetical protein